MGLRHGLVIRLDRPDDLHAIDDQIAIASEPFIAAVVDVVIVEEGEPEAVGPLLDDQPGLIGAGLGFDRGDVGHVDRHPVELEREPGGVGPGLLAEGVDPDPIFARPLEFVVEPDRAVARQDPGLLPVRMPARIVSEPLDLANLDGIGGPDDLESIDDEVAVSTPFLGLFVEEVIEQRDPEAVGPFGDVAGRFVEFSIPSGRFDLELLDGIPVEHDRHPDGLIAGLLPVDARPEPITPGMREQVLHAQRAVGREDLFVVAERFAAAVAKLPAVVRGAPAPGRAAGVDRSTRDVLGGVEVFLHQERVDREHIADVVEPVADVVDREVVGGREVDAEQVMDRGVVLGPVQAAERHTAGLDERAIELRERRRNPLGDQLHLRRARPGGDPRGRHVAILDVILDQLPAIAIGEDLVDRPVAFQIEIGLADRVAVATVAILRKERDNLSVVGAVEGCSIGRGVGSGRDDREPESDCEAGFDHEGGPRGWTARPRRADEGGESPHYRRCLTMIQPRTPESPRSMPETSANSIGSGGIDPAATPASPHPIRVDSPDRDPMSLSLSRCVPVDA